MRTLYPRELEPVREALAAMAREEGLARVRARRARDEAAQARAVYGIPVSEDGRCTVCYYRPGPKHPEEGLCIDSYGTPRRGRDYYAEPRVSTAAYTLYG